MSKRTWIGTVHRQMGEYDENEAVLVPANDENQKPDEEQLKAWTLDWMGYDQEDDEQRWEDSYDGWWIGNDDGILHPVKLERELTDVEVQIWDIAHNLKRRPFCLNDFMMLAESDGEQETE